MSEEPRLELVPVPGSVVVAHLREPREKIWGLLLAMETPGIWLRGLDVNTVEDWMRQLASAEEGCITPTTLFLPYLRLEKMALDEPLGPVPSIAQRFRDITGREAAAVLGR